jgi:Transposase IS116/IS110/IS902 family
VLAFVHLLRALNKAVADLDRAVRASLAEHPDAEIYTSLPRSGQINAAQILAEWGDCRDGYDNAESVAALAGVSPVTKQSGKYRSVGFRWACNKRFRNAIVTFADNSRHASPWAAGVCRSAIERGRDQPSRHPNPRPRLDPRDLPLLARPGALRADQTRSRHPVRSRFRTRICGLRVDTEGVVRPRFAAGAPP